MYAIAFPLRGVRRDRCQYLRKMANIWYQCETQRAVGSLYCSHHAKEKS